MGIDLCGSDRGVPEKFLNGADISTIGEEGGSKRMAECMCGDILRDPSLECVGFYHVGDKESREAYGLIGEVNIFHVFRLPIMSNKQSREVVDSFRKVLLYCIGRLLGKVYDTDFSSFSPYGELPCVSVYTMYIQCR